MDLVHKKEIRENYFSKESSDIQNTILMGIVYAPEKEVKYSDSKAVSINVHLSAVGSSSKLFSAWCIAFTS